MAKRLLTAAVGIPVLYLVVKKGPVWFCFALVAVCSALAAREACLLLQTGTRRPLKPLAMLGSVAVAVPFIYPSLPFVDPGASFAHAFALMVVLAAVLLGSALTRSQLVEKVEATIGTLFAVVFVGIPLGFLTGLRAMQNEEMGRDLLVLLLMVIWIGDTAAMYVGAVMGRHPLAPRISPKKTVEGAVAGVVAGIGAALLAHIWWFQRLPVAHAVLIGLLLGVAGIGGDLAESVLKRAAGAKDSSSILPGHGGILDRIDSLLFAGPVLYYYYLAFLQRSVP